MRLPNPSKCVGRRPRRTWPHRSVTTACTDAHYVHAHALIEAARIATTRPQSDSVVVVARFVGKVELAALHDFLPSPSLPPPTLSSLRIVLCRRPTRILAGAGLCACNAARRRL